MHTAEAQTDSLNLDQKFRYLLDRSETYDVYKVIRFERLNSFWNETTDTLNAYQEDLTKLKEDKSTLSSNNESLQAEISSLKEDLNTTSLKTGSISFLGMQMQKGAYHVLVWLIILVLAVVSAWFGLLYKNSFDITRRAQKDQEQTAAELEAFKESSREKQIKLKRELQTALNQMEELKRSKG